mmetsp:Transcript_135679/g.421522  ORF Transcript_135679/g.421522 Transcript_135679/m.421522 type:complete len:210 (+) Transcript_135679:1405-2034(+)
MASACSAAGSAFLALPSARHHSAIECSSEASSLRLPVFLKHSTARRLREMASSPLFRLRSTRADQCRTSARPLRSSTDSCSSREASAALRAACASPWRNWAWQRMERAWASNALAPTALRMDAACAAICEAILWFVVRFTLAAASSMEASPLWSPALLNLASSSAANPRAASPGSAGRVDSGSGSAQRAAISSRSVSARPVRPRSPSSR